MQNNTNPIQEKLAWHEPQITTLKPPASGTTGGGGDEGAVNKTAFAGVEASTGSASYTGVMSLAWMTLAAS